MGVMRDVEVTEIELPNEAALAGAEMCEVSGGVSESETELDEIQSVDV